MADDYTMGSIAAQDSYDPFGAEKFVNPAVVPLASYLANIPRRATENSQNALDTGNYDPGPTLDAAGLAMTGGIGGTGPGGFALGAGPVRRLAISDIEHGESAMPGGGLSHPGSRDLIKQYADSPEPIAPIEVLPPDAPGGKWMVYDGSHRLEAAKLRGDTHIDAFDPTAPNGGGVTLGSGPVRKAKPGAPGEILNPGNEPRTIDIPVLGPSSPINAPYIQNPQRVANPGIYKRPDVIAAEAAARVEPEHPALKQLFGVTRQDLYDISQQGRRQGNMQPDLWQPSKTSKPNEAALSVMNPANEQRILDTLGEARKHPGLEQGMVPWYVMDPMYQQMVKLVGPERAAKEYHDFNMSMTPFSAGSSVPSEINRGTAANMMRQRGEYDTFKQYGGIAVPARGADYPEILRDVKGMMGHLNQANPVERYMQTGQHGYGKDQVKINLYSGASGVPETGFQTTGAVPDAHFTRAVGVPDARANPNQFNDYMGGTEYRQIGPWYRQKIADPLGIEAVPAQALMWGTYGPQTGVKTKIGAGKLELISKAMWERAQKLGIDPRLLRDQVLRGEQHSELEDDNRGVMGSLADQSRYG